MIFRCSLPAGVLTAVAVLGIFLLRLDDAHGSDASPLERGRYLAQLGNCVSCHTREGGAPMAGGLAFHTPFGVIYSTNITPDPQHGLGKWTEADFLASMKRGVRPSGEHLYPVFPYTHFSRVSDDDLSAIWAYLQTLVPSSEANLDNALAFPMNYRPLMAVWKWLFFTSEPFEPDPSRDPVWNRGAYLVEGLAHCSACHSPRNLLGAEKEALAMSGGELFHAVGSEGLYRQWSAPDITGGPRGLASWSDQDLVDYLTAGRNAFLDTIGPMNEVIFNSTRYLAASDADAINRYLRSLPSYEAPVEDTPDSVTLGRGRTVYNLHCGTCHLPTGAGDPEMGPRLNRGSLLVQARDPASLINVILYGPELATEHADPRWLKPMEEFQYILDDQEVAAVATYIRHAWDNAAGIVTPEQVAAQR